MSKNDGRVSIMLVRLGILLKALFATSLLLLSGCDEPKEVSAVQPELQSIQESFSEPARTRLAKTYSITMPITGRIGRIDLEPGDRVSEGKELVVFDRTPFEQQVAEARAAVAELQAQIGVKDNDKLEETALVETKSTIEAAEEALKASEAQVEAEQARTDRAAKEYQRLSEAAKAAAISASEVDDARLQADTSLIELRRQQFFKKAMNAMYVAIKLGPRYIQEWLGRKKLERKVLVQQLAQAKVRLEKAEYELKLAQIKAPIAGVVLNKQAQGEGYFDAGIELLMLGNLNDLEVVADVLTQDAMKLKIGSLVSLETYADDQTIPGKVKKIEPAGFTKLSSLGVEQQRVKVIIALEEKVEGLGVGFRVQAKFITGAKDQTLVVPRFSVLQASDFSYYVFKIVSGKLQQQAVKVGLRSDLEFEVLEGLSGSDQIVATPDAKLEDGDAVVIKK